MHLTGRVADIQSIRSFCSDNSIHIIEDSAQSFGAHDEAGHFAGSLGVAGAFIYILLRTSLFTEMVE